VGYRVQLVDGIDAGSEGLDLLRDGEQTHLGWDEIRQVAAADVGEPDGVLAVVVELACGVGDGEVVAGSAVIYRFALEPGIEASAVAKAILDGVGKQRCTPSVATLVNNGRSRRWFSDLASLEEANLEILVGS